MTGKVRTSLTSLERLEAQIRALPDGTPQGAAWEEALVRWVNGGGHPDLVKGWGWKQWPGRAKAGLPRIERGVDLIAEDRAGRLVAIQAKFRNDPDSPVKTGEVQKFVGAYRKHFPRRMLISNASSRARGIKEAVGDGEAELVLRTDLSESLFDWIASKPLPRPKVTPLPFQKEAAAAIKKHLKDGGRAQIVMACGSGKTYTTLLAMEALGSKRVLVLAPTLLLIKQLRDEWMRERTSTWATLAVCSDIGADEGDDSTHVSPGELGSKPTTDPVVIASEIKRFVKAKLPYVIFGTYASSARIATAQKKAGVPAFDLVVADEAHRIAGAVSKTDKGERAQRVVLDEKGIRAERRLFATATPRVYGGDKKKDGEEIVLESMDDPARFGEEVYKLTFQQAVDLERLVPYKLLVTIVTNEEVKALIHDRVYLDVHGKKITIDDLATAIAVRRAYKELGISRVISYHGSIKRARAFAQLVQEVKAPGKAPETECVTGAMPVEDRKEALSRLANAEGPYLITNARCLTEGIDVPALDAVAFVDPRKSQVDIVQAVGRTMRKPRGASSKTTGYIILPVFLSKADLKDPEAAVESSAFAPVLQVLRALKAHDPYRAPFFAKILVEQGKRPHKKGEGIDEILQVSIGKELHHALAKRLEQAVQLRAVEVAAGQFEIWLDLLRQFVAREGHARVPAKHIEAGRKLGNWVLNTRQRSDQLSKDQLYNLERLGFIWNTHEDAFERNFERLTRFVERESHSRVPDRWIEDGVNLGAWVSNIRAKQNEITADRKARLDQLGFIWNADDSFERNLTLFAQFVQREGHARVAKGWQEDGVLLFSFVSHMRQERRKGRLSPKQVSLLDQLGFVWETRERQFTDGINAAQRYVDRQGNLRVPDKFIDDHDFPIGSWIGTKRQQYKNNQISHQVVQLLEAMGMIWEPYADQFDNNLKMLADYVRREGHAEVPQKHIEAGFRLGTWVGTLRQNKDELDAGQKNALEQLGFVWNVLDKRWNEGLAMLRSFRQTNGEQRITKSTVHKQFPLGKWLNIRRNQRRSLSKAQIQQLDELGMDWDPFQTLFLEGLAVYKKYIRRTGSSDSAKSHVEEGYPLGAWLNTCRVQKKRGKLSVDRIKALDSCGIRWAMKSDVQFELGLQALRTFVKREGHADVKVQHIEGGYRLGRWISKVRGRRKSRSDEQVAALDRLGFIWDASQLRSRR